MITKKYSSIVKDSNGERIEMIEAYSLEDAKIMLSNKFKGSSIRNVHRFYGIDENGKELFQ